MYMIDIYDNSVNIVYLIGMTTGRPVPMNKSEWIRQCCGVSFRRGAVKRAQVAAPMRLSLIGSAGIPSVGLHHSILE